jgi:hypothetical protein
MGACKSALDPLPEWTAVEKAGDATMTVAIIACNNKATEAVVIGDGSEQVPFCHLKSGKNFWPRTIRLARNLCRLQCEWATMGQALLMMASTRIIPVATEWVLMVAALRKIGRIQVRATIGRLGDRRTTVEAAAVTIALTSRILVRQSVECGSVLLLALYLRQVPELLLFL